MGDFDIMPENQPFEGFFDLYHLKSLFSKSSYCKSKKPTTFFSICNKNTKPLNALL